MRDLESSPPDLSPASAIMSERKTPRKTTDDRVHVGGTGPRDKTPDPPHSSAVPASPSQQRRGRRVPGPSVKVRLVVRT